MKDRIRKLRRTLDLTQQEFADKIGIKRNTIANYESGRNLPVDSVISLICREFNVREEWLRDGTGEMFIEISRDEQIAAHDDIIQTLMALDADDWNLLLHTAFTLANKRKGVNT